MSHPKTHYRIQITVAVYKNKKMIYKNDLLVPSVYQNRSEAREHIRREIRGRLENEIFFRSPRADFDLVKYEEEATKTTYIRYRIIEDETNPVFPAAPEQGKTAASPQ